MRQVRADLLPDNTTLNIWEDVDDDGCTNEATAKTLAKISAMIEPAVACFVLKKLKVKASKGTANKKKASVVDAGKATEEAEETVEAFSSLNEIGRKLIELLRAAFPKAALETLVQRWPASADATPTAPTEATTQRGLGLLEYDATGKLISPIGQLWAKGIDFGTIVVTAGEPASWQVSSVSGA